MATGYWFICVKMLDAFTTSGADQVTPWFKIGRLLSPSLVIRGLQGGDDVTLEVWNDTDTQDFGEVSAVYDTGFAGVDHATIKNVSADGAFPLGAGFGYARLKFTKTDASPLDCHLSGQIPK